MELIEHEHCSKSFVLVVNMKAMHNSLDMEKKIVDLRRLYPRCKTSNYCLFTWGKSSAISSSIAHSLSMCISSGAQSVPESVSVEI